MAFETDCGSSTALEDFRVVNTVGFPVPGEYRATCHAWPRDEALRNSATPTGGSERRMQIGDVKSEIRNPKSEILWATPISSIHHQR